ncbi:hypothetical protein Agub_g4012 [Astrephomene gubernaculifera]|uniref:RRM domain-containing protein n=1 Tax=Astrephomene gubernaculifera TaxID=47775 RepID=A0AAD3HJE5_9CHLO|nr:hypothetical protein Agub_g4012 [Astrephomene gubernaculifera]
MAADPGLSGEPRTAHHHLFISGIPPRLPKEEVEAALAAALAEKGLQSPLISVVPQSAWKNKGFGFVDLAGSPSAEQIAAAAAALDNSVKVGGKAILVQVCRPSASGAKPIARVPLQWDQPAENVCRLCAQVLHMFFARRLEHSSFKAEKLLYRLSITIAPSCGQKPMQISAWGRDVFGSLEQMLLAIGDMHFGGGWTLTGTVADRNAVLEVGKARYMHGWDPQGDPTVTAVIRLAACKQRLDDLHTPEASTGFSTPSMCCRRCSDCGSDSPVQSTDQPSCSQSEASWSPYTATRGGGSVLPASSCTSQLLTTVNSSVTLAGACSGGSCGEGSSAQPRDRDPRVSEPDPPETPNVIDPERACRSSASTASLSSSVATIPTAAASTPSDTGRSSCGGCCCRGQQAGRHRSAGQEALRSNAQHAKHGKSSPVASLHGRCQASLQTPQHYGPCQPVPSAAANPQSRGHPGVGAAASPPSRRGILERCARCLQQLFASRPYQHTYTLSFLVEALAASDEVVAWGKHAAFFSLVGYAEAVYGSFEGLLLEVERLYFGGSWRFGGGMRSGEPRVICIAAPPMGAPQPCGGGGGGGGGPKTLRSGGRSASGGGGARRRAGVMLGAGAGPALW